jgi:hypothetical protein
LGLAFGLGLGFGVRGSDWGGGYLGRPLASSAFSCANASALAFLSAATRFLGGRGYKEEWGGLGVMALGIR